VARVWRRRRSLDTPRPAGRRWDRIRRGGSHATQVIAQVTRRRREPGESGVGGTQVVYPHRDRTWRRIRTRRGGGRDSLGRREAIAPVSPALVPSRIPREDPEAAIPSTIPLLPGERTPARRVKFAIANACTVGSLMLGMGAVFLAIRGDLRLAALAILACVVFDGLDGGLARKFGVVSPFGAQMDSLADLGSFGVATGLVVHQWLVLQGASPYAAAAAACLVVVCAAIRLARFNVSPKDGRFFCGVPTTMAAAVLALNILVGPQLLSGIQVVVVLVCALAMVSSFPYAKLVRVLRLPPWLWAVPAIGVMISLPATFAVVVGGYLLSGPVLALVRRRPALA
jgi:CDP-diacylglycerol--serine O-phosphatidyltransferase